MITGIKKIHKVTGIFFDEENDITTIQTYNMEIKGLVRINKEVTPHIYCAMIDRESCQQKERHSFLHRVYSGSTGDLIAAFLKEEPISQEEREKLRKILDDMEV